MKKVFIILTVFIITSLTCLALDYPRWKSMPIPVYVPKYGTYSTLMIRAFNAWQNKSNNLVRFQYVSNPRDAGIVVHFVEASTECNSDLSVGCTHYTQITNGCIKKIDIDIATKEVKKSNSSYKIVSRTPEHLYGVMIHEIGHALGFMEHSKNPKSVMNAYDLESLQYLTKEDMQLLYKKYH